MEQKEPGLQQDLMHKKAVMRFYARCIAAGHLLLLIYWLLSLKAGAEKSTPALILLLSGILPVIQICYPSALVLRLSSFITILLCAGLQLMFPVFYGVATASLLLVMIPVQKRYWIMLLLSTLIIFTGTTVQTDRFAILSFLWTAFPWFRIYPSFVRRFAPREDG